MQGPVPEEAENQKNRRHKKNATHHPIRFSRKNNDPLTPVVISCCTATPAYRFFVTAITAGLYGVPCSTEIRFPHDLLRLLIKKIVCFEGAKAAEEKTTEENWRPQGDSNPRYRVQVKKS